jgi:catechol 2,3-dioxygenase-like lactoylglutathione lyase family enzyme
MRAPIAVVLAAIPALASEPALSPQLAELPLRPGAWKVTSAASDAGTAEPGDAFVRAGPGGSSLIIETAEAHEVLTFDATSNRYRLDRYASGGNVTLVGKKAAPLVLEGSADPKHFERVTLTSSATGVTVRRDTGANRTKLAPTEQSWVLARPAAAGRATGVGGVFFKAADAKKVRDWYRDQLGLPEGMGGEWLDVRWRELNDPGHVGHTVWAAFKKDTKHFDGACMVNYRVDDLDAVLAKVKAAGAKLERTEDEPGNGRFAWIRDPENNLVELWQPPGDR